MTLSITAQAILASHFAWSDDTVLTMGNEVNRMTPACRDAMTELIMGGVIVASKADDCRAESMEYQLTEKGKKINRKKPYEWMIKNGGFPFTEAATQFRQSLKPIDADGGS